MSMFHCARCHNLRDSDDGCEEFKRLLVCAECADEMRDETDRGNDAAHEAEVAAKDRRQTAAPQARTAP